MPVRSPAPGSVAGFSLLHSRQVAILRASSPPGCLTLTPSPPLAPTWPERAPPLPSLGHPEGAQYEPELRALQVHSRGAEPSEQEAPSASRPTRYVCYAFANSLIQPRSHSCIHKRNIDSKRPTQTIAPCTCPHPVRCVRLSDTGPCSRSRHGWGLSTHARMTAAPGRYWE